MKKLTVLMLVLILIVGCSSTDSQKSDKLNVVTTTTMVSDLVKQIGKDHVDVKGLMEAGVDPHLYQAKASDASTLQGADLVIYNGVHLEAKLIDILASLDNTISLESGLSESDILSDGNGGFDPHIWFSVPLWKKAAAEVEKGLSKYDPDNEASYKENLTAYLEELDTLQAYITERIAEVPESQRVLVTAHDAFNYFAHSNGFQVKAIQGISTEAEAATSAISELASFIATNKIKAVFTESSISPKTIESLQKAVESKGFEVKIGEQLFSDSLKENSTYIETYTLNIDAIVEALK